MPDRRIPATVKHALAHIVAEPASFHRAFKADGYRRFTIPKNDGGTRIIDAPRDALKADLREALGALAQAGVFEPDETDHGFATGRGVHSMLKAIQPPRALIQGDLEKAFHQITRADILAWAKAEGIGYKAARWVAAANTRPVPGLKGARLVMGSPMAPALLLAITRGLRQAVARLARVYKGKAVWYADNLVIECPSRHKKALKRALIRLIANQRWTLKDAPEENPSVLGWTYQGLATSRPGTQQRPGWTTSRRRRRAARGKLKRLDHQAARLKAIGDGRPNRPLAKANGIRAYLRGPAYQRSCSPRYARATV